MCIKYLLIFISPIVYLRALNESYRRRDGALLSQAWRQGEPAVAACVQDMNTCAPDTAVIVSQERPQEQLLLGLLSLFTRAGPG